MAQDAWSLGCHESDKKSFEHGDGGFEMQDKKMRLAEGLLLYLLVCFQFMRRIVWVFVLSREPSDQRRHRVRRSPTNSAVKIHLFCSALLVRDLTDSVRLTTRRSRPLAGAGFAGSA